MAVTTSEKMPPPISVIGQSTTSGKYRWMVAKVNWNAANDPPDTTSAGQTSKVLRQLHMQRTIQSGTMNDRIGSWWPAMTLSVSVGSPSVTPERTIRGVPSPP